MKTRIPIMQKQKTKGKTDTPNISPKDDPKQTKEHSLICGCQPKGVSQKAISDYYADNRFQDK
jgi:hypothetical protein